MAHVFLICLMVLFIGVPAFAVPQASSENSNGEVQEFWPPDLIPHPHLPGSGPSGPGEPEMA
ncbi:MAG: hypothetical protein S4CHLAM81_11490 [Chlamydiales bacterium]|nr:hypothetical protein [Chlamydiales bacterium]MCH9635926.1 hypothetical protein [Chlamydiales bacterium]MCH9704049.1 hypothetical protein [Chlamydiota bacterium]